MKLLLKSNSAISNLRSSSFFDFLHLCDFYSSDNSTVFSLFVLNKHRVFVQIIDKSLNEVFWFELFNPHFNGALGNFFIDFKIGLLEEYVRFLDYRKGNQSVSNDVSPFDLPF